MPKATIKLPDGTQITIDGTQEEVQDLLSIYKEKSPSVFKSAKKSTPPKPPANNKADVLDHAEIVRLVKDVDEAELIERNILDRTSQVDRTLLPLYIVSKYLDNAFSLTSGDINKITTDLGIPISTANASRTLSGTASRYVIGDKVRKKGRAIRYKLSRRGITYMDSVISGSRNED